ncbi:MAG: hypothetical protein ACHQJ6_05295, partial [Candidatus Berkiellales bacterium]
TYPPAPEIENEISRFQSQSARSLLPDYSSRLKPKEVATLRKRPGEVAMDLDKGLKNKDKITRMS